MGETDKRTKSQPQPEALLTPAEVAALFRVDPKTVTRWAKAGKLSSIRTLGGSRRYRESEVRQLLRAVEAGGGGSKLDVSRRSTKADVVPLSVARRLDAEKEQVLQDLLAPEPLRELASAGAMESGDSDLSERIEELLYGASQDTRG